MKIFNTALYGFRESIIRSGYPMKTAIHNFCWSEIHEEEFASHKARAIKLANSPVGSGHGNFLKGIIVQMDVEAPQYIWMQIERYQFFTIISSQSKMHKLTDMNIKDIPNVGFDIKSFVDENIRYFKEGKISHDEMLAEVPMGLELTAGITTNYMCLKNMYHQRKNHRLKFWTEVFCPWVESLPMAKELIIGETN